MWPIPFIYRHKGLLLCYWQRLEQKPDNPLLHEAFIYARNHNQFSDLLNSDETIQMPYKNDVIKNQQCIQNTRSSIKQKLQKKFSQDWFKSQNDISESSRQKYTNKEIKKDYRLEQYLNIVRNPAYRISRAEHLVPRALPPRAEHLVPRALPPRAEHLVPRALPPRAEHLVPRAL